MYQVFFISALFIIEKHAGKSLFCYIQTYHIRLGREFPMFEAFNSQPPDRQRLSPVCHPVVIILVNFSRHAKVSYLDYRL